MPAASAESMLIDGSPAEEPNPAMGARQNEPPLHSAPALGLTACSTAIGGDERIHLAALLAFCDPLPQICSQLESLNLREWRRLLRWLDFSGLALYFYDRIRASDRVHRLPHSIAAGLQKRLEENTQRTGGMLAESIAIQRDFQKAGLCYALLKGISFWPSSVPKPELRLQFDLDYLVAEVDIPEARKILARRGYRLYAANGQSWEFKRNERPGITRNEMYKHTGSFRVELHAQPANARSTCPLQALEWREFGGFSMPVLSAADLLLGQGLHVYKHIGSEFLRASYLLEFRRHVLFRRHDRLFWRALRDRARGDLRAATGLGVVSLLIGNVMGEFAPESLTSWTVGQLPARIRLWVETYAARAALGGYPGSKLYVLLKRELDPQGRIDRRPLWRFLLPPCLPPPVIHCRPGESLPTRLARFKMQIAYIGERLRFHIVQGLRLAREMHRWRRLVRRVSP